ncbi:pyridoxamine 5'-phosphate oxidase family protein [Liquorilactobacillus capillatus]|uniref:Major facilitator superfamily permease n=1 Tax=Liquorilactobacillus capillatus DSM 19910 TaxID=1423731 RepID=A0A0R1LXY8_9LACO|nr:pyridoxamine 5'-phosphate oxidase family protein [Liquorilactobacillus capillatus]KRL00503.1 major facilitator superfamily permease [Liquorilactobacillus capillatus DSM 19910]
MYVKRFVQLFLIFLLTIFMSMLFISLFGIRGYFMQSVVLTLVGYIILVIPLTILTILKQRKKFNVEGTNENNSEFKNVLSKLDNIIILSTLSSNNVISSSIITFKQSRAKENVFYIMSDSKANRVRNIEQNGTASLATWFDEKKGIRISSNKINAEIVEDAKKSAEIAAHPEIKELSDDLKNNTLIRLTIKSVLIESFQTKPLVITFL